MANTTYTDYVAPTVNAEWLNEVNDHIWSDTPVSGTTVHGSDVIEFIQAGTGASATTLQTKGRESVSSSDFGVVADGSTDDATALNNLMTYCASVGAVPRFPRKATIAKTGTLNLIDFPVDIDWNGCKILQKDASDSIWWESSRAGMRNLWIEYDSSVTAAAIIAAQCYGIKLSAGQGVSVNSESAFSALKKIWVWRAWRGIGMDSSGAYGGLIWQFRFEQCYAIKCYDYQFYINSTNQTSTTTTFANCHAGCKWGSIVSNGGGVYVAKQHHTSSATDEPGVGASWADYWVRDDAQTAAGAWALSTYYTANGKGFYIYNDQTCVLDNCSMDGGDNLADGNVIYAQNSYVDINTFHLEGHNLFSTAYVPVQIGSDCRIGEFYLYDLRPRLPNSSDIAYLIGGINSRLRSISIGAVRNHSQNATKTGVMYDFNGGRANTQFAYVNLGPGVNNWANLPADAKTRDGAFVVKSGTASTGVLFSPFTYNVTNPNSVTRCEVEVTAQENTANYAYISYKYVFVLANDGGVLTASAINSDAASQITKSNANYAITPTAAITIVDGDTATFDLTLTTGGALGWATAAYKVRSQIFSNKSATAE